MFFQWLKQYMPKTLYGRAALILIVPIVTLQLGVSTVFIQRHFEDVTRQLTRSLVLEVNLLRDALETSETFEAAEANAADVADRLQLQTAFTSDVAMPEGDFRRWIDITGITVISALREGIPDIGPILLLNDWQVRTYVPSQWGTVELDFSRNRVSASNPHQLIVWTFGLGVLMIVIAYLFLRNQLRPIKRLSFAAEAFGRGRHLPYAPTGAREVRSAGNAFLSMRARIERHIEQRTLMLSGVSHDLRSPLTRLKLALSMTDDPAADDMRKDVEDMQRLLDEFLTFARRDADNLTDFECVDPLALVQDLVSDYQKRNEPVELGQIDGMGEIEMRPIAIKRALDNLIGNAIRYGTQARVSARLRDKSLTLCVEDNGPGIPKGQRGEALKPFARLDPSRNQNKNTGVGLGLSITADIARAHGGQLRLGESQDLGGLKAEIVIARSSDAS